MIVRELGPRTRKEVTSFAETSCPIRREKFFLGTQELLYHIMTYWDEVVHDLGKPNVHLPELESNPGVWLFSDTDRNIIWIIFSDCHRKNKFKGTSLEYVSSNERNTEADIAASYRDLLRHVGAHRHRITL